MMFSRKGSLFLCQVGLHLRAEVFLAYSNMQDKRKPKLVLIKEQSSVANIFVRDGFVSPIMINGILISFGIFIHRN